MSLKVERGRRSPRGRGSYGTPATVQVSRFYLDGRVWDQVPEVRA